MARSEPTIVAVYEREIVRFESGTAIVECRIVSEEELNLRARTARLGNLVNDEQNGRTCTVPPGQIFDQDGRSIEDAFAGLVSDIDDMMASGDSVRIKVDCEVDELMREQEYLWRGKWFDHDVYGRQFHASSFVLRQPHGRTGIIAYLARAGEGNNLGKAKAAALWDLYGSDAVTMMRTRPSDCVQELYRKRLYLHEKEAEAVAAILEREREAEECTLDLMDVLDGRGFPKDVTRSCQQRWGLKASQTVRRDPYKLMAFPRCGFRRCDAAYLELGHNPLRLKRQALAAWYAVKTISEGHTWVPMSVAIAGVRNYIGGTKVEPERAVQMALGRGVRGRILAAMKTVGQTGPITTRAGKTFDWVAEAFKAKDEADLADTIVGSFYEQARWPDELGRE